MDFINLANQPMLVVVGSWQAETFSRPFINNHLFENNLAIVDDIGPTPIPGISLAFGTTDFRIQVQQDRLCFFVLTYSGNIKTDICFYAAKILQLLPFTPVKAFGINYKFKLAGITSSIFRSYLEFVSSVNNDGYTLQGATTQVSLTKNNYALNISAQAIGPEIIADINIDYQVSDITTVLALLSPEMMETHETEAKEFISRWLS